jgi:hypothetical protein
VVSISGCDPLDPGSNPGTAINLFVLLVSKLEQGGLAHLVERLVRNQQAGGSKPPSSTTVFLDIGLVRKRFNWALEGASILQTAARLTQSVE